MTFETHEPARVTPVAQPFGLRVSGEIDWSNRRLLADALEWALTSDDRDIRLDLSGLTFIDVAGLRLIVAVAARLSPPRGLILSSASPLTLRLLDLTGWEHEPGLSVIRN
ncbi:STAS domain-containing protein [Nonomuraea jiangxiensis]|uniref:Anti-anti-sigma factor n=1 Tax=Nonomuraea jiangxiensis TaxID=633440 RepID=A0A1G9A401_9ACTN|nr:STAS domain-containing protein [Nonomuraea jiangxiensis]SDK22082.1 anti-anti-sigma factor [Nonomuraea jiangxiensis]